jgi:hypothetical protein
MGPAGVGEPIRLGGLIEAEGLVAEWALSADSWNLRGLGWMTPVQARPAVHGEPTFLSISPFPKLPG